MEAEENLRKISDQLAAAKALLEDVPIFVRAARLSGATWTDIGTALGVTKQRAHQLYAHRIGYEFPGEPD
jgi:hypothetical protein